MTDKYRSFGVIVVTPLNSSLLICCTGARKPSRSRPVVFTASKETHSGTGWLIFLGIAPPVSIQHSVALTQPMGEPAHQLLGAHPTYLSFSALCVSRSNSHSSTSCGTRWPWVLR